MHDAEKAGLPQDPGYGQGQSQESRARAQERREGIQLFYNALPKETHKPRIDDVRLVIEGTISNNGVGLL